MATSILSGRDRVCKNSQGGIQNLWLFPYVKYNRSQIITNGNVLTNFPTTTIYRFNVNSNPTPTSTQAENAGGKYYDMAISLDFIGSNDSENLQKLLKKDYRLIFQDRNGLFRIFGLYTGLICESLTFNTGSAKTELNGFNLSFNGQEEKGSFFINDLENAGFFDADFDYRITEAGEFRILENNEFRITNNG
jgi:hypothetical protein